MSQLDTKNIIEKMFIGNRNKRVKINPKYIESLLKNTDERIAKAQDKAKIKCA